MPNGLPDDGRTAEAVVLRHQKEPYLRRALRTRSARCRQPAPSAGKGAARVQRKPLSGPSSFDKTTKDIPVLGAGGFVDSSVHDTFCSGTTCTISYICRSGCAGTTCASRLCVVWFIRRPRHVGQKPRPAHVKATRRGKPQSSHARCAKPRCRTLQSRYRSNSARRNFGSSACQPSSMAA